MAWYNDLTMGGGWTRPDCGAFVNFGDAHGCNSDWSGTARNARTWPTYQREPPWDRIIELLERIANALEEKESYLSEEALDRLYDDVYFEAVELEEGGE